MKKLNFPSPQLNTHVPDPVNSSPLQKIMKIPTVPVLFSTLPVIFVKPMNFQMQGLLTHGFLLFSTLEKILSMTKIANSAEMNFLLSSAPAPWQNK